MSAPPKKNALPGAKSYIVPDMGRRRGQRKGTLRQRGASWLLEWREYHKDASGQTVPVRCSRAICPTVDLTKPRGKQNITRKEAERLAWELVLSKLDAITLREQSLISVGEFIRRHFEPEWVWSLKPGGRRHYQDILKHITPSEWLPNTQTVTGRVVDAGNGRFYVATRTGKTGKQPPAWPVDGSEIEDGAGEKKTAWRETPNVYLSRIRIKDVTPWHCQQIVKHLIEAGKSTQTATHARNALSAIFSHAIATGHYSGPNPAQAVRMPEMVRKPSHALTAAQSRQVFEQLAEPARSMALVSMLCSLNVAELCGLRACWVNLSDEIRIIDAEAIPSRTLAVREQYYRGVFTTLKTGRRRRNVPLAAPAVTALRPLVEAKEPRALVFQSTAGTPVNEGNLARRVLAPLGRALKLGYSLSWHVFRHTAATLAEAVGMPLSDRQALMGHGSGDMTMRYTHSDIERMRGSVEKMEALVFHPPQQQGRLEQMRPATEVRQ